MTETKFFYANQVTVGHSNADFTLILQRMSLPASAVFDTTGATPVGATTAAVDRMDVCLSPTMAKSLAALLLNSIQAYEAAGNGVVPLSPNDQEIFDGVVARFRKG